MAIFNCFSALIRRKKKNKGNGISSSNEHNKNGLPTLQPVKVERHHPLNSRCRVTNHESPANCDCPDGEEIVVEVAVAYEGEDERDDDRSPTTHIWRRDDSELNLHDFEFKNVITPTDQSDDQSDDHRCSDSKENEDIHGNLSDPGATTKRGDQSHQWGSPKLKRSCSSLDTREVLKKIAGQYLPQPSARELSSQSFDQLQEEEDATDAVPGTPCSHTSAAFTHFSADKVILKKRSFTQILPSRSRKLWWKLFLWSHRNSQKQQLSLTTNRLNPQPPRQLNSHNQQGGYSSDTFEPSCDMNNKKSCNKPTEVESPSVLSSAEQTEMDSNHYEPASGSGSASGWKEFQGRVSGQYWPQNQWLAFSMQPSSPLSRVDEWVRDLDIPQTSTDMENNDDDDDDDNIEFPPSPETNSSKFTTSALASYQTKQQQQQHISPDLLHANSVIQSLNSSSTVAHISGMGLKVIPTMSLFFRLRSVNLSNNSIAHIPGGSLPTGLHSLDLSRNKITNIEGLKELTRLRILNLSYNRISRISHGLSSCVLLKELYLAGNKISEVEGLHRLLKLTLLDLSFNKITTSKALGQLVANYNSLVALNLLGNPIQSHLSDDQLRKAMCGLLPRLAYLNKQPINQQKAREVASEISVKASSSGINSWNHRKRTSRRTGHGAVGASVSGSMRSFHGGAYASRPVRSNLSAGQKGKSQVKKSASQGQLNSKLLPARSNLGAEQKGKNKVKKSASHDQLNSMPM